MGSQTASRPRAARLARREHFASSHWTCEPLEPRIVLAATPVVIDLLAVYTPAAATNDGGDVHIKSLIQQSVDAMNQAMINSQISITIRLVHAESIAYTGSDDLFTDRVRLETPGDGYLDTIFALRNQYGADLVTLITDGQDVGGGNADLPTAINDPNNPNLVFSAIAYNSIGPKNLTIAHELGHTLGAGHERNNPTQPAVGPFPYSYGYRYSVTTNGQTASYNDIMSYQYGNDVPIPYYANPAVSFGGAPTGKPIGDPNAADLASTFLQTAPMVANYRATVVPDTTAPTASLYEINRAGSSLTFTVLYKDDSGIDLSTIDSSDIIVSGPGGFVLPATFVSMDHPTVAGATKLATYHVLLPATNPATTSLSFILLASAIRDLGGRVAAPGVLAPATAHNPAYVYASAEDLGTLVPTTVRTEYGAIDADDYEHVYKFTLTSTQTVSASLSGVTGDAGLYFAHDDNGDANNQSSENFNFADNPGATEGIASTLAAGTYYVWVYEVAPTPFVFTLRAYTDTAAPTAVADTKDLRAAGAPYVDFAVTYTDDNDLDGLSTRYDSAIDIHAQLANGADFTFYYYPDFNLNGSNYDNSPTKTIYYRVFAGSSGFTTNDNGTYTLSIHDNSTNNPPEQFVHDAAGHNIALQTIGSFKIAIGATDTTTPTATLSAAAPVPALGTWDFNVLYKDGSGIDTTSLDNSDVRVTGPNSFNQLATFVGSFAPTTTGGTQVATYRVTAPGGYWDSTDDGAYTIAVQPGQVKDTAGNFAPLTSFSPVNANTRVFTSLGASGISFVGTSLADIMRIDSDASFVYFTFNDTSLYFTPKSAVPRFTVDAALGDDSIFYQSGTLTGSVLGGAGNNSLTITGGSLALDADAGASPSTLAISLVSPASLTFNTTQHLTALTLTGSVHATIKAGGANVLVTKSLSIPTTAGLNVNDNAVIVDYTGATPIATIRTLLQTGFNAGTWKGNGIASDNAHNDTSLFHGVGYAEASSLGISTFLNQSVDTTAVIIRYTKYGDNNLDGTVDIGNDFSLFLDGLATPNAGSWLQGDYTYDGKVDLGNDFNLFLTSFVGHPGAPGFNVAVVSEEHPAAIPFSATPIAAPIAVAAPAVTESAFVTNPPRPFDDLISGATDAAQSPLF